MLSSLKMLVQMRVSTTEQFSCCHLCSTPLAISLLQSFWPSNSVNHLLRKCTFGILFLRGTFVSACSTCSKTCVMAFLGILACTKLREMSEGGCNCEDEKLSFKRSGLFFQPSGSRRSKSWDCFYYFLELVVYLDISDPSLLKMFDISMLSLSSKIRASWE